jgi:hypothetical protein
MLSEQIKTEISKQINDQFKGLKEAMELFTLPFKSQYMVLSWDGAANGTALALGGGWTVADITNRTMIIKSVRLIPYYSADGIDFNFSDGTTANVWNNTRIERLFDFITVGTNLTLTINDMPQSMFKANDYNADLFIDNIFYKYPEKIQNIAVQCNMRVVQDMSTGAAATPNVRVVMEVYLI